MLNNLGDGIRSHYINGPERILKPYDIGFIIGIERSCLQYKWKPRVSVLSDRVLLRTHVRSLIRQTTSG